MQYYAPGEEEQSLHFATMLVSWRPNITKQIKWLSHIPSELLTFQYVVLPFTLVFGDLHNSSLESQLYSFFYFHSWSLCNFHFLLELLAVHILPDEINYTPFIIAWQYPHSNTCYTIAVTVKLLVHWEKSSCIIVTQTVNVWGYKVSILVDVKRVAILLSQKKNCSTQ